MVLKCATILTYTTYYGTSVAFSVESHKPKMSQVLHSKKRNKNPNQKTERN
jgi:hypothetical protein